MILQLNQNYIKQTMENNRFSESDLKNLGLELQSDGSYSKKKQIAYSHVMSTERFEQKHPNVFWKNQSLVDVFKWCEQNKCIFIPGQIPSSKNSRINFVNKSGKQMSIKSKTCQEYKKNTEKYFMLFKSKFLSMLEGKEKPYRISFRFIRNKKNRFDYINPCQTIQDIMVYEGWLKDDCMTEIIPSFEPYGYDKQLPGVIIKLN